MGATRVTTAALSSSPARGDGTRTIAWWLLACAAMVFAMAVITVQPMVNSTPNKWIIKFELQT